MKIVEEMLSYYMGLLTIGYVDEHGHPDDLADMNETIEQMHRSLLNHGHTEPFRLGLEHVLAHPEFDADSIFGMWHGGEDVRDIAAYVHRRLFPDAEPIPEGGPPGVQIIPAPGPTWDITMNSVVE